MSSSDRLNQVLQQYNRPLSSQYPDIRELTQLLSDVTHDGKVRMLKSHTALYKAAFIGHAEIITTILTSVSQHQRLDVLLQKEYTPLHHAAHYGKSDSVETILAHFTPDQQLEVLSVRYYGWTPADWASYGGCKKTERQLRDYQQGADQQMNTYGETALLLYSRVGREEGAVKEADILESGFRTQGSHVTRHEWTTACDIQDKLHTFIQAVPSYCQMLFVCVMSHGAPGVLCGTDGVKLPLNDLLDQLNALPVKLPLVMLVQACQNANMEPFRRSVELVAKFQATDASRASPPESSICSHIDLTRPHSVLLRSTVTGGYSRRGAYTEALAHQIGSADGMKSIHEMHEDAVKAMRSKFGVKYMEEISQVPEYRDTLQGEKLVLNKAANQ